jgi:hypothetical protein
MSVVEPNETSVINISDPATHDAKWSQAIAGLLPARALAISQAV